MRTLLRVMLMGLMILGVVACSNDTQTAEKDTNDESETSDAVLEDNKGEPANETTEDENMESTSDGKNGSENTDEETSIQPEQSGEHNSTFPEKYEKRQWTAEQEGITYQMTVDFANEKEGTFDWLVTEGNTENPLEDIKDIPFTIDTVNPDGNVVAYYQYEDELDGALVEGQLKFQENSIEFARYRFLITLE